MGHNRSELAPGPSISPSRSRTNYDEILVDLHVVSQAVTRSGWTCDGCAEVHHLYAWWRIDTGAADYTHWACGEECRDAVLVRVAVERGA